MPTKPSVLFVCVHNAGRSQMAAALVRHHAGDTIEARSAGSAPAETVNPMAVAALAEWDIDLTGAVPQLIEPDVVGVSDVVITMGCGDACPVYEGVDYRDWALDDPADLDLEAVRPIRDEIDRRVRDLVAELTP